MCGFGAYKLLLQRLELTFLNPQLSYLQQFIFSNFCDYYTYNRESLKIRLLVNIYLLELLGTYRGWRHARGLPVRGQRTWSNAWSVYRSNTTLREYKIQVVKRLYGQNFSNEYYVAYLAEEVNNMWRLQWEREWRDARKKRLVSTRSNIHGVNIDLVSMSKMQVGGSLKKKDQLVKKTKTKKNCFTLGFDPGFTKLLLKNFSQDQTIQKRGKLKIIIFENQISLNTNMINRVINSSWIMLSLKCNWWNIHLLFNYIHVNSIVQNYLLNINSLRFGFILKLSNDSFISNETGFKLSRRSGLLFFKYNVVTSYWDYATPSVEMRHLHKKVLMHRRLCRLNFKHQHLRSKKLTKLMIQQLRYNIYNKSLLSLYELLQYIFKVFSNIEILWLVNSGLITINFVRNFNEFRNINEGDLISWIGGLYYYTYVIYFKVFLSRWLIRKKKKNFKKLSRYVFFGGDRNIGSVGFNRWKKTTYTSGLYNNVEVDLRMSLAVIFFKPTAIKLNNIRATNYLLKKLGVWGVYH